jgi:hypothetical protein
MQRIQGYVEQGNTTVTISGDSAVQKFQGSFPGCTVTVYAWSPDAQGQPLHILL